MLSRPVLGRVALVLAMVMGSLAFAAPAHALVTPNPDGATGTGSGNGSTTIPGDNGSGESVTGGGDSTCWSEIADPPGGFDSAAKAGNAWYGTIVCADGTRDGPKWHPATNQPIGGPSGPTPEQVATWAWEAAQRFELAPISIGMAPKSNPDWGHRRTYIGVPVWLWVDAPSDVTWGPFERAMDLRTVHFSFQGQVDRVVWDLGDGTKVTCGLGQAYVASYGITDSPSCGHRYEQTSLSQPSGKYPVTATSYWNVVWSGAGQSGSFDLEFTTSTEVEVLELQSVNVTGPPGPDGP